MSQKYENVIVFGPTGAVGSAVAMEASKRGAKVWLAMRDPKKSINTELDNDKHSRVQADLEDPASIMKAIQTSGAKAAFFYLAHHSQDGMKSVVQAMKDAGITYVVFLSSFTICEGESVREIPPERLIPFIHARVEVNLEDIGIAHVALRPGNFASNGPQMWMSKKKTPYEGLAMNPDRHNDCIVPSDIGKIGGAVLVDRPSSSDKEIIYIFGPELITYTDMWKKIQEVSGKEIKIVNGTIEEKVQWLIGNGAPPPLAEYIVNQENAPDEEKYYPKELTKVASSSIRKYAGYEPTTFKDFLAQQTI